MRHRPFTLGFGDILPLFSADPPKLCQVGLGPSVDTRKIGFKSGFWPVHSRAATVVLALSLGSLARWKVNLHDGVSTLDQENKHNRDQGYSVGQRVNPWFPSNMKLKLSPKSSIWVPSEQSI